MDPAGRTRLPSCAAVVLALACTPTGAPQGDHPGWLIDAPAPGPTIVGGGSGHSCVLRDEYMWCWGDNTDGALGDGTRTNRLRPTPIVGLADVVSIAPGWWHSCALDRAGKVWCWGRGEDFPDGEPDTVVPSPVMIEGLDDIVQLDAKSGSCAVRRDGTVWCWGSSWRGRLGDGSDELGSRLARVRGLDDAVEVAVGSSHACARRRHGAVVCWGENAQGQLLEVDRRDYGPVAIAGVLDAVEIVSGSDHSCVRSSSGHVSCWGANSHGQLGTGEIDEDPLRSPTTGVHEVVGLHDVVELAAGGGHTCARRATNEVLCWGQNKDGQLGDGTNEDRAAPVVVAGLGDAGAQALGLGIAHSCALRHDGELLCWGFGSNGELGDGLPVEPPPKRRIAGSSGGVELVLGSRHACIRRASGVVQCWGNNLSAQLGDGTREPRAGVDVVPDIDDAEQLSAGEVHTCARRRDHSVSCWGDDTRTRRRIECRPMGPEGHAQVIVDGEPDETRESPVAISSQIEIIDIDAQGSRTCAVGREGEILCWASDAESAELVDTIPGALEIAIAGALTCVRSSSGEVSCQGSSQFGGWSAVPIAPVTELVGGEDHICALRATGQVACWGQNDRGQLGDGTTSDRSAPVTALGLTDVIEISAGDERSCALTADRSVWCWGDNANGAAGAATATDVLVPTRVEDLRGAAGIATGHHTTCARIIAGEVVCWGEDQLQPHDVPPRWHRRSTPTPVQGLL